MGVTRARFRVANPAKPENTIEIEAVVNTGSTLSWIRRRRLESLGIKPYRRQAFKTITGQMVERDVAAAMIIYDDHVAVTDVVAAEDTDTEVIGAITLEALGYRVNPVTRRLEYVGLIAV